MRFRCIPCDMVIGDKYFVRYYGRSGTYYSRDVTIGGVTRQISEWHSVWLEWSNGDLSELRARHAVDCG